MSRLTSERWSLIKSAFNAALHDNAGNGQGADHSLSKTLREYSQLRGALETCERLKKEAELRERWIAVLGHDLRNPIQAIQATVQLLSKENLDARSRSLVHRVDRVASRMARLVNDMHDFARGRQVDGSIPVRRHGCALRAVCEDAVDELRAARSERRVSLEASCDGYGSWDRDRIEQMLSHVIGNALSYGDPSKGVRVTLAAIPPGFEIAVHNWGDPIDPEDLPTLFEPFRRGNHKGGNESGLGLGLFFAQAIAKSHGGEIRVSSSWQDGTTFHIALDRAVSGEQHA